MNKFTNKANFYMRLSALIMLLLFLVVQLITVIYFPDHKFAELGYGERVANYYAFFTTESNYMVAIYFIYYLYADYYKNAKPHIQTRLSVTVYITITMLVYWIGIFIIDRENFAKYTFYDWTSTLTLHLIMPVVMITSFIFTSGQEYINLKKQHKGYLWFIGIYPAVYAIVILIRGHLRYLDFLEKGCPSKETWYPYPFFNYNDQPNGVWNAILALIVIFGLVFSLQYFYLWINNLMHKHYQTSEWRLYDFYQKVLRKLKKKKQVKK